MLNILRTDGGLVEQVLAGKVHQFDELVRRHFRVVFGIAYSYTRNHADAEDLCQEAFLKAYRSLDTLNDTKRFGSWVGTITRNLARVWYRKSKREAEIMAAASAEVNAPREALYDDMREVLEEQINALEPIAREVLMLHYFSEQSTGEIAKVLGVSQAAVLKRLQRAREALGVKLIHELKVISPEKHDAAVSRKHIMGSITASGIIWRLSGGNFASAAVSSLLSAKGLTAGLVVTCIVLVLAFWKSSPVPQRAEIPITIVAKDDTNGENQLGGGVPIEELPSKAILSTEVSETESLVSEEIRETETSPEDPESLKGRWEVYAEDDEEWIEAGILEFTRSENTIITDLSDTILDGAVITGSINGRDIVLDLFLYEKEAGQMKGRFNETFDAITVIGDYIMNGESVPLAMSLKKLKPERVAYKEALAMATERLEQIGTAIQKYKSTHKVCPSALEDLYPKYISNRNVIEGDSEELLTYYLIPKESYAFSSPPSELNRHEPFNEKIEDEDNTTYLFDWDDEVKEHWGDTFPHGPIMVCLENKEYGFSVLLSQHAGVFQSEDDGEVTEEPLNKVKQYASEDLCKRNLQDLERILTGFSGESLKSRRYPVSWAQTYPKHYGSRDVFHCPSKSIETFSYKILYPASNGEERNEIFAQVTGVSLAQNSTRMNWKRAPVVIETHECSNLGGRHVLYAGGKVEFIKNEDWATLIEPYVAYAYE